MAAYQEITVSAKFSSSSSLLPADEFKPDAYNPGAGTYRVATYNDISAATGGTTIDLGAFTTVTQIIIKNTDATNYVEATFRTTGGAANNQVLRIPAGSFAATGSAITVASDLVLTANTSAVVCDVCIVGT